MHGVEPSLAMAECRRVLEQSGLAATQPVTDEPRLARMLATADLIVTARRGGTLLELARALTKLPSAARRKGSGSGAACSRKSGARSAPR